MVFELQRDVAQRVGRGASLDVTARAVVMERAR